MPTYLFKVNLTADGFKGLLVQGAAHRREVVERMVTGQGGRLEAMYWASGQSQDEVYILAELPSNVSAAEIGLVTSAAGGIRTCDRLFDDFLRGIPDESSGSARVGHGAEGTGGTGSGDGWESGEDGPDRERRRKGGWSRTLTGVAVAAVTTVLAVVVVSEVTDVEGDDGNMASGSGARRSVDSADAASPVPSRGKGASPVPRRGKGAEERASRANPLSYADKMGMAHGFPMSPKSQGTGRFTPIGGHDQGRGGRQVLRYRVDVETGLPLDGELFAQAVHKTLNDERSWSHAGARSFERVSSGSVDFVITLAGPGTTAEWCAKSGLDTTQSNVSCNSRATERVMINGYRWAKGADTFGDRMHAYRQMLINHEVGHRLGFQHEGCERDGAPAPVMMQQTKTLSTEGRRCRPNPWPYP